jgi:AAA domain-containing protein
MDRTMNRRDLYVVEKYRPPRRALALASDRGARQLRAPIRPEADTRDSRSTNPNHIQIHRFVDLKKRLEPLRYTIDRVVRRGSTYTLTGPTGDGKTAWCMTAALAVATGRSDILNLDVERGRVLYLAIENPYDTVSRFTIAQRFYGIPSLTLGDRLFIVTVKATPESVFAALKKLSRSGAFALVIVDTLAAYFDGTDMNDNVAAGNFMRRLRTLTTVLGNPAVVVPAHPIKGATEASLSPYGGGAIVNEVDGNLTLWRRGNACKLHWQTKLRGPNFAPVLFRFREYGCNAVRDAKGRPVIMPLLVPYAERAAGRLALPPPSRPQLRLQHEQHRPREDAAPLRLRDLSQDRERPTRSDDASPGAKLLRAMIADPHGTQQEWGVATGVVKSNVNRRLMRLQREGLVHGADRRWTVTPAGKRTI